MEHVRSTVQLWIFLGPPAWTRHTDKAVKALISRLNNPYPQHIISRPPGVGKTICARLVLMVKETPKRLLLRHFFIEVDGTGPCAGTAWITNPLGSVHDPIYQGHRRGISRGRHPEPKLGLVSEAHGGILFIDELGDMDHFKNKLWKYWKIRVYFESSYYDPYDERIPHT